LDKNGNLATVGANLPVLEFNADATFRGYRVGTSYTNLFRDSEPIVDPGQGIRTNVTFASNDWGIGLAGKVVFGSGSTARVYQNQATTTAGETYTVSCLIKPDDGQMPTFGFGAGNIGFLIAGGSGIASANYTVLTTPFDGIFFVRASGVGATASQSGIGKNTGGVTNNEVGFEASAIMVVEGSVALNLGNYIKTTGIAVTIDPDIAFLDPATDVLSQVSGSIFLEWENPVAETVYLDDFEFAVVEGVNQLRFDYSPTVKSVTINGVQLDPITGDFDFSGLDRIEVGNFDGDLQPDNIYFRAIQTGQ
jgi:hypothetical protein